MGRKKTIFPFSVETPCKCGCGEMVKNPDPWGRYREFLPEHVNRGETHPRWGVTEPQDALERRVAKILERRKQVGPTCLERDLYTFLDQNDIKYQPQVQISSTIVDAYLPQFNMVVFADGEYWHNKPGAKERDKKYADRLTKMGYNVLRLRSWNYGYNLDFTPLKAYLQLNNAL